MQRKKWMLDVVLDEQHLLCGIGTILTMMLTMLDSIRVEGSHVYPLVCRVVASVIAQLEVDHSVGMAFPVSFVDWVGWAVRAGICCRG